MSLTCQVTKQVPILYLPKDADSYCVPVLTAPTLLVQHPVLHDHDLLACKQPPPPRWISHSPVAL